MISFVGGNALRALEPVTYSDQSLLKLVTYIDDLVQSQSPPLPN